MSQYSIRSCSDVVSYSMTWLYRSGVRGLADCANPIEIMSNSANRGRPSWM